MTKKEVKNNYMVQIYKEESINVNVVGWDHNKFGTNFKHGTINMKTKYAS